MEISSNFVPQGVKLWGKLVKGRNGLGQYFGFKNAYSITLYSKSYPYPLALVQICEGDCTYALPEI